MTRKKAKATDVGGADTQNGGSALPVKSNSPPPPPAPSTPTLVICRNKYPIDPAVFFDLVKIRRLIDDATSLAVRAANGTTSSSLNNSLNGSNGMLSGSDAEILGIGSSRGGGNAKLSRERKHRMREHATQKLSQAYRLDEIATSVVTMQSASALEDVAKFVLQREETNVDAQYVHFFHEKIPSRALAASTTLDTLNDIIHRMPTEASTYRTRAVTRMFKRDATGAVKDLTDGLATFRLYHTQAQNEQRDLVLAKDAAKAARDYNREAKVAEKDQPSSLEPQFLFHRANTYLTMACDYIADALHGQPPRDAPPPTTSEGEQPKVDPQEKEAARARAEARKYVRTYAKRALRDYMGFLGHLEYTPGLSAEYTEAFLQKIAASTATTNGRHSNDSRSRAEKLLDIDAHSQSGISDALVKYDQRQDASNAPMLDIPKPKIYKVNALFAPNPPADLPPFPPSTSSPTIPPLSHPAIDLPSLSESLTYHPLLTEVLHSLLLAHALVQTSAKEHQRHAYMTARLARVLDGYPVFLAARSPSRGDWSEILRRTGNYLQLQTASWDKLCTPAPPPGGRGQRQGSKSGGTAVVRKGSAAAVAEKETAEQKRERIKRAAIEGAMGDERVVDEETFRRSVAAREALAEKLEKEEAEADEKAAKNGAANSSLLTNGSDTECNGSKTSEDHASTASAAPEDKPLLNKDRTTSSNYGNEASKDYPISTDRADLIVRWIREAPPPSSSLEGSEGGAKKKSRSSAAAKGRLRKMASQTTTASVETGMEQSVESLTVD
ncbi:uncharacterized protein AB675_5656 [Cyphellophora attinorum]|uniref:Uncharacterized protein n=1 Tax=Cyphellophora attinorum TaxID=1664694 RepID=A0A0N1P1G2_9EURO|nr:uncharacterized protein AB675_5656 [Phialophora attinorum]KPI42052.1 hypothetical protein AB675_5656 [Phialophora attinorum]